MCRFTLYLGEPIQLGALLVAPNNSLVHQSLHSPVNHIPVHGDGFGVAWYAPEISPEPAVFRCVTPAWNNQNLKHLTRVTQSPAILAHVRAASPGIGITEANCHPFSAGRLAFAHNGFLARFPSVRRHLANRLGETTYCAIEGSTDSEYIFALFRERYGSIRGLPGAKKLGQTLEAVVLELSELLQELEIEETSYLNLAVTDGEAAAAVRFTTGPTEEALSLHACTGKRYSIEKGDCQLSSSTDGAGAVLISSEALCDDSAWITVPPQHVLTASGNGTLDIYAVASA